MDIAQARQDRVFFGTTWGTNLGRGAELFQIVDSDGACLVSPFDTARHLKTVTCSSSFITCLQSMNSIRPVIPAWKACRRAGEARPRFACNRKQMDPSWFADSRSRLQPRGSVMGRQQNIQAQGRKEVHIARRQFLK
jgi:hypothetical protein